MARGARHRQPPCRERPICATPVTDARRARADHSGGNTRSAPIASGEEEGGPKGRPTTKRASDRGARDEYDARVIRGPVPRASTSPAAANWADRRTERLPVESKCFSGAEVRMESLQSVCWREAVHYAHFNGWSAFKLLTRVFGGVDVTLYDTPIHQEVKIDKFR